jgi:hypothetical protein
MADGNETYMQKSVTDRHNDILWFISIRLGNVKVSVALYCKYSEQGLLLLV